MKSPRRRSVDLEVGFPRDDGGAVTNSRNSCGQPFRRWRSIVFAINASRRFKFGLDFKKELETDKIYGSFGSLDLATRATHPLPESPIQAVGVEIPNSCPDDEFGGIRLETLVSISRDDGLSVLKLCDGVTGLSHLLQTDLEKGICGDDKDILRRREVFGSNTYPLEREGNFWMFLGEASRGFTLIVLVFAAMASLLLQIKTKTINHGWYDEAGIIVAVILVIFVTAISNYNQSLQFEKLNDEKRKMCIEVTRNARRTEISIYDIVVGDIIPLKSGDQVPADGVLVSGYSLQIGEYESMEIYRTVHKDTDIDPILISGSKVKDGIGTMLEIVLNDITT